MDEWREEKWGKIASLKYGKSLREYSENNREYPVFGTNGQIGSSDTFLCPNEGVIIGRKGAYRGVHYSKKPFFVIDTAFYLEHDPEKVNIKFAYYQLTGVDINSMDSGSAIPSTSREDFYDLDIHLPPLPEQRAIAEVLSSLDDKIDLLHRQNKTLEGLAETLFRQWFVEEAEDGWEMGTLEDVLDINMKYPLKKDEVAPYLEMKALSTEVYHPTEWIDRPFSSGTKFKNGDTLLARITPCLENGKAAFVDFMMEGQVGWGSTEFLVFRPKPHIHPLFAYVLSRLSDFRAFAIGSLVGSSGRQRVDLDNLKSYELMIPSKEAIERFNTFAESALEKMRNNHREIRTLTQLRDTLLPKLMSGEVRVQAN